MRNLSSFLPRWLLAYLIYSGLAAHVLFVGGVLLHYQRTGKPPTLYLLEVITRLERSSPPFSSVGAGLRAVFFDTGLMVDPAVEYPSDLTLALPDWRGQGANALRAIALPRYTSDGRPIATTEEGLWQIAPQPALVRRDVDSMAELARALVEAVPGQEIVLNPGVYRLHTTLSATAHATARRPIVIRGNAIGAVTLEIFPGAGIDVSGSYWTLSDLVVRGQCGAETCPQMVRLSPAADAFTVRNLFLSGIQTLIATPSGLVPRIPGLIDAVTLVGARPGTQELAAWPTQALRRIQIPPSTIGFYRVCPGPAVEVGCDGTDLAQAVQRLGPGGLLLLRTGTYRAGAPIDTAGLHLLGEPGAHIYAASVQGKGALVTNADVTIEGIECSYVKVGDGNGACVRQQHGDLTLIGVHFHHSQMGVLTGHNGGHIRVLDSYLHDSGYDEDGMLGHNIYVNSGTFEFIRSWSLSARNAGHEFKSRAERTLIEDSLLVSLNARDSRLIDIPWGGVFELRNSVLGEGPRSENWELIGYGLELKAGEPHHPVNTVLIEHNTLYVDRPAGANILNARAASQASVRDNTIVGSRQDWPGNRMFEDREAAGVGDYPSVPALQF